jgi:tetratricopeptide (TPR) repeat protein
VDYETLYDRILRRVDQGAYLAFADAVPKAQQAVMAEIGAYIQSPRFSPSTARELTRNFHAEGRIDRIMYLSALHVIAMSPAVKDYTEAARLIAEKELEAMTIGGPDLPLHLASVDRHRGAIAFLTGNYEVALDYFSRAFERQRSAGNLGNVLAALIRLGDVGEARELLVRIRSGLPDTIVGTLNDMIQLDPDLALLRTENRS